MAQYDDLYKEKDEQDEKIENIKYKNRELEETLKKVAEENDTMTDNIMKVNDMIKDSELRTKDKETEKKGLEADTATLREDIKK